MQIGQRSRAMQSDLDAPGEINRCDAHSFFFEIRRPLRPALGSSSGSGVSCSGRSSTGTWRRFNRILVHVLYRPRIESTSTSSTARYLAALGCQCFHRSRPARAASVSDDFAMVRSGIFVERLRA